jgi:hypothetical protein
MKSRILASLYTAAIGITMAMLVLPNKIYWL